MTTTPEENNNEAEKDKDPVWEELTSSSKDFEEKRVVEQDYSIPEKTPADEELEKEPAPKEMSEEEINAQIEALKKKKQELSQDSEKDVDDLDAIEEELARSGIEQEKRGLRNKSYLALFILGAIVIGFLGAYFFDQWDRQRTAENELQELAQNQGDFTAVNTDVLQYGDNEDSYALGVGSGENYPQYGTLVFRNEEGNFNRTVDLYVDYSDQRSVDLLRMNNSMLQNLVETGEIELRLHPVPSEHPLSVYATETLAQVMHRHPDKVWEVNISLQQIYNELRESGQEIDTEELLERIEEELNLIHDIQDIDADRIREGMFFDWFSAVWDADSVSGQGTPLVYSGGELIEENVYHNPDELREHLVSSPEEATEDIEDGE